MKPAKTHAFLILATLCLPMANGAYTYVDAGLTNTTLNGTAFTLTPTPNYATAASGSDGLWSFRSSVTGYENSNYFESDSGSVAGDGENTAPLITTITLTTIGTYDIVAVFARNLSRDIAAKIGSAPGPGDVFTTSSALTLNPNQAAPLDPLFIPFDASYTNIRGANAGAAYLGQFTTTSINQTVSIYINGLEGTAGTQDERTQYDGIGFQLVPEPSAALLGGLGVLALLRRRRSALRFSGS